MKIHFYKKQTLEKFVSDIVQKADPILRDHGEPVLILLASDAGENESQIQLKIIPNSRNAHFIKPSDVQIGEKVPGPDQSRGEPGPAKRVLPGASGSKTGMYGKKKPGRRSCGLM